jgi:hypothetical protein
MPSLDGRRYSIRWVRTVSSTMRHSRPSLHIGHAAAGVVGLDSVSAGRTVWWWPRLDQVSDRSALRPGRAAGRDRRTPATGKPHDTGVAAPAGRARWRDVLAAAEPGMGQFVVDVGPVREGQVANTFRLATRAIGSAIARHEKRS